MNAKYFPQSSRRGTMLIASFILIPMAMALLLLFLTRVETAVRETKRYQCRTQARLLAESALAQFQTQPAGSTPPRGRMEGAGTYTLSMGEKTAQGRKLLARGITENAQGRFICEIEGLATEGRITGRTASSAQRPPALRLINVSYHIEAR